MKRVTIAKMYKECQDHLPQALKLLTDFEPNGENVIDFWKDYRDNAESFDRSFARNFANFEYYNPLGNADYTDWAIDVRSFLKRNEKRYAELYRIKTISDEGYDIKNNYDRTDTFEKTTDTQGSAAYGQRTDVNDMQTGNQKFDTVNKAAPFNAATENVIGSTSGENGTRNDKNTFTKGKQEDTNVSNVTEEYTLHSLGNIGVMTQDDVMLRHWKCWEDTFDFYSLIFLEMAAELLQIGGDNLW